jgi:hypothetical protein
MIAAKPKDSPVASMRLDLTLDPRGKRVLPARFAELREFRETECDLVVASNLLGDRGPISHAFEFRRSDPSEPSVPVHADRGDHGVNESSTFEKAARSHVDLLFASY